MSKLGSEQNPLRVAIVGSGPSGFYATEALLRSEHMVKVDLYERLPAPFGLVRNGVAPDHPKLKKAIGVYQKIAQADDFNYLGNVTIGTDIGIDALRAAYHATILTCGAETDRRLGIPGEDLPGSYTATEFVGWYNGHPDYRDRNFDLSQEIAVIIGQGNVAADVARILAKTVDELKHTDIAEHALDALADSRIKEIHVIGRRGPAQAKFTSKELKEFNELQGCTAVIPADELTLNPASEEELSEKGTARNVDLFRGFEEPDNFPKTRQCFFEFLRSPKEIIGNGRIERVLIEHNALTGDAFSQSARGTGETYEQPCGILFRSIGYRGIAMPNVPFDDKSGVFPNQLGRVLNDDGKPLIGLYAAGWIKRGPTGIIGTNRADAVETVNALLEDLAGFQTPSLAIDELRQTLVEAKVRVVSYPEWESIDASEIARGEPKKKPREKFTRVREMLELLDN